MLSFFSGAEVAATAFTEMIGQPVLHMTWETDPVCAQLIAEKFPSSRQRGDVLKENAASVVEVIDRHDKHQTCVVVLMASPPCPDFSAINSSAEGLSGEEGSKFTAYAELARAIEGQLGSRETRHLVENVVMQQRNEAQHISSALDATPVVVDAADFGLIGRPRMWWTRIEWRQFPVNPITGSHLRWGKHQGYPRIYIEAPLDSPENMYMDGHSFHPKIAQQVARLPCMTTPAPDDSGRSAPKKCKQRLDQETSYQEHCLLTDETGRLVTPTIQIKEQLHHLDYDYTWHPAADDRARHRMMGNSWHKSVVKFMLLFLLQCGQSTAVASWPRTSALDLVCSWARGAGVLPGPPPPRVHQFAMPICGSMVEHWQAACGAEFPTLSERPMAALSTYTADKAL